MTFNEHYTIALLERIAYQTQGGPHEFEAYIERIKAHASDQYQAEALHGDLRARPAARTGYVPGHDPVAVPRLRGDEGEGAPAGQAQVAEAKNDKLTAKSNKWGIKR